MSLQVKEGDKVTIVIYPPKPPGPPRPNLPPVTAYLTRKDGSFQVLTTRIIPELRGFQVLNTKALGVAAADVLATEASTAVDDATGGLESYGDCKQDKFTKREALIIQSQALSVASQSISLQSELIQAQLEALDKAEALETETQAEK
ncbi:hypothetical protein PV10_08763 [Exophiala mesophila]|uniref:Uncharacterized protein n=1 Tax=Exophiala mesophila TaxID=212818 RepID=A0A0D1Z324_EXOME|nr:uncharacterized protein PV10_08763 [Exophiala mesophila]KIV89172.1 hypothetical protein PV10_08763 [Exophiala mesophila]